jgi:periplasmic copper chaperone A
MSRILLTVIAALLFAGGAAAQNGSVSLGDAWARATPSKAENGAAYLTLESPSGDRLTGASTPVAKTTELNDMKMEGMVMKMRSIPAIDLPAGQKVTLKPGGLHIMLRGLTEPLREGQSFPLTLDFETAGKREVTVAVEKAGAGGPGAKMGGMPMPSGR